MRRRIAVLTMSLLLVLGIAVTPAMSVAAAPSSADAEHRTLEYIRARIESYNTGRCLDSNWQGQVYTLPCGGDNNFQRWDIWNGGWTKNVATGYCLYVLWIHGGSRPFPTLRTGSCVDQTYMHWTHWNGGWYQTHVRDLSGGLMCIASYKPWWESGIEDMTESFESCYDDRPQWWGQRSY